MNMDRTSIEYLFYHILDGFKSSHEGLKFLRQDGILNEQEYNEQMVKNADRLVERIEQFKVGTKILSLIFVALFTWLQISPDHNMDNLRRGRRSRRRNEIVLYSDDEFKK